MRGNHLVAAIVVATIASGALFLRNRLRDEKAARDYLAEKAEKAEEAEKATNDAKKTDQEALPGPATAAKASSSNKEPVGGDPVRISTRITVLPRKKPMQWELDLDGDGTPEVLAGYQKHAADSWTGGKKGAPQASLQIRTATGKVLRDERWVGYMHGFWRRGWKVGGGRHVLLYQRSRPDERDAESHWLAMADGKVITGDLRHIPLRCIDVTGDGVEVLTLLSPQLYQEYMKEGTMDVVRWDGRKPVSVLPDKMFEVCALDPGMRRPLAFAAVTRAAPHRLHILGWNAKPKSYVSYQALPVSPPDDGAHWQIEEGFALDCRPGFDGSVDQHVQYKTRHFAFTDARLREKKKKEKEKKN